VYLYYPSFSTHKSPKNSKRNRGQRKNTCICMMYLSLFLFNGICMWFTYISATYDDVQVYKARSSKRQKTKETEKIRNVLCFATKIKSVSQSINQSVNQNISTLGSSSPAAAEFNLPTNALLNPNPNPPDDDDGSGWI